MRQKLMFSKIVWQWSRILRKGCWLELKHSIELKYTMLRSVLLLAMSLFLDTSLFSCLALLVYFRQFTFDWPVVCVHKTVSGREFSQFAMFGTWFVLYLIFVTKGEKKIYNLSHPAHQVVEAWTCCQHLWGNEVNFPSLRVNLVRMLSLRVPQCCSSFLDRWQQTRPSQPRWACCQPLIEIEV